MRKASSFGRVLARLRREQGFTTPYAFYRLRDGRRVLKLTFVNYLSLESGKSLPKPWRLEPLFAALGLEPHSAQTQELFRAYLADLLGSEELLARCLPDQSADPAPQGWKAVTTASRQALSVRRAQLSHPQLRVLAAVPAAYACYILLASTEEGFEIAELARLARAPLPQVRRALKALIGVRLVRVAGQRARCPVSVNFIPPPAATPVLSGVYAALQNERARWVKNHGRVVHAASLHIRAKPESLGQYLNHLSDAVHMAAIYAENRQKEGSDIYLVESRVTKLFGS